MKWFSTLLTIGVLSSASTLVNATIQANTGADVEKRNAIKDDFVKNWQAYRKYAGSMDKLAPISMKGANDPNYGRMSGTMVDALSTLVVMGMANTEDWKACMDIIKKIDYTTTEEDGYFSGTPGVVSLFEMTVRHMGGLLSAYQMNGEKPEEKFLVDQAQSLADSLSVGWYNGSKIPWNYVNLKTKAPHPADLSMANNLAAAGTLSLEWTTLSKYTGNPKYADLALGTVDDILKTKPYFPYIWPNQIHPKTYAVSNSLSLGGGYDSFVEYMIKYPVLLGDLNHPYSKVYQGMINSIKEKLLVKTGVKGYTFTADYQTDKKEYRYVSSHLACFLGGNVAYAGKLHRSRDWFTLGLELTESCYMTARESALGIPPFSWGYFDEKKQAAGWDYVTPTQRGFYNEHGIFVQLGDWLARPEIMEGLFYSWRTTGQQIWRDYAWEYYQAIKKVANTPSGAYAGVVNVNDESSGLYDQTESLLYSEIFKYLYLIFDDTSSYSLDDYVFTARGHILKRGIWQGKKASTSATKRQNKEENNYAIGKVQDYNNVNYVSLAQKQANHTPCSEESGKMPTSYQAVKPGSGKQSYADAICSQLGMDRKDALLMLAGIPPSNNTVVKG